MLMPREDRLTQDLLLSLEESVRWFKIMLLLKNPEKPQDSVRG